MIACFMALTKATIDAFALGAGAAISLYCGTKMPRNRRGKK